MRDYLRNEIAQTAALRRGLTTAHSARLFALLNLSLADSVIAFYDAGTPATSGARSLPSKPPIRTQTQGPGVARHFESFSAAEREASLSRLLAGVHLSTDEQAGQTLGRQVAGFAVDHSLRKRKCEEWTAP
jgi:hypothetical protein